MFAESKMCQWRVFKWSNSVNHWHHMASEVATSFLIIYLWWIYSTWPWIYIFFFILRMSDDDLVGFRTNIWFMQCLIKCAAENYLIEPVVHQWLDEFDRGHLSYLRNFDAIYCDHVSYSKLFRLFIQGDFRGCVIFAEAGGFEVIRFILAVSLLVQICLTCTSVKWWPTTLWLKYLCDKVDGEVWFSHQNHFRYFLSTLMKFC